MVLGVGLSPAEQYAGTKGTLGSNGGRGRVYDVADPIRGTREDDQFFWIRFLRLRTIDTTKNIREDAQHIMRGFVQDVEDNHSYSGDRLVIFSERIRTVEWLADRLVRDLNLPEDAIGRIDGGSVEADDKTQKLLVDFGQENAPIRILLASDMASEGLNLHFQCHRLIHFDLPWSLLRFQQRNGRIDRYGQDRTPEIEHCNGRRRWAPSCKWADTEEPALGMVRGGLVRQCRFPAGGLGTGHDTDRPRRH